MLTRSLPESPITTDPITALRGAIAGAAEALAGGGSMPSNFKLERPPKPELGDYSTNAAMLLAPALGEPPRVVAERLGESVREALGDAVERIEVAGPGFLNLFMTDAWFRGGLAAVGDDFGSGRAETPGRVLIEFVSANPTGPVTVASGRHAAYGDSLARIVEFAGHSVDREFYVNDAGTQIVNFGESLKARARGETPTGDDHYKGEYLIEVVQQIDGAADMDPADLALAGVELMLAEISKTLERFRVHMDAFFSERSLLDPGGAFEKVIGRLRDEGQLYESDGAIWLRTTNFGDDKDRVVQRSTGEAAYFGPDIAYHEDKRTRGYDWSINVLGADHHGYVARIKAAWLAIGGDPEHFEVIIMQLVNLFESGQRVQMSKRAGTVVPLDELVDDIGVDAARFFLLQRSHDTALDLDLALARDHSDKNPVYYVQYAHARIASILRRAEAEPDAGGAGGALHPSEKLLIKRLLEFPTEIDIAVDRRAPHRMTTYLLELAQDFAAFYRDCHVVGTPEEPFRLALSIGAKSVLARSLDLLGVSSPEEM